MRSRPCACCKTGGARPGGVGLPARRNHRVARGPGDAARADRRPPRRSRPRGASGPAGRRRPREELHEAGARRRLGPLGGRARSDPTVAGAEGAARRTGRPAFPRARAVRLPPGSAAPGRVRDAVQARPEGTSPRRRRSPPGGLGRARGRRGGRLSLPRRLRGRSRRAGRAGDQGEGARGADPSRRARGDTGRGGGGPALLSAERGSHRAAARAGGATGARREEMAGRTGNPEATRELLERSISIYEAEGKTHAAAGVLREVSPAARLHRAPRRVAGTHGTGIRGHLGRRARRGPGAARRAAVARLLVRRRPEAGGRPGRARARD